MLSSFTRFKGYFFRKTFAAKIILQSANELPACTMTSHCRRKRTVSKLVFPLFPLLRFSCFSRSRVSIDTMAFSFLCRTHGGGGGGGGGWFHSTTHTSRTVVSSPLCFFALSDDGRFSLNSQKQWRNFTKLFVRAERFIRSRKVSLGPLSQLSSVYAN